MTKQRSKYEYGAKVAYSPNGRLRLEVSAPRKLIDSLNIMSNKVGSPGGRWRMYAVFDNENDELVWECQKAGTSPWAVWVDDDARGVVLHADDSLMIFSRNGTPAIGPDLLRYLQKDPLSQPYIFRSTAGFEYSRPNGHLYRDSWVLYLCLKTAWGKRVILDVDSGRFVEPDEQLLDAAIVAENEQASARVPRRRPNIVEHETATGKTWPKAIIGVFILLVHVVGFGLWWWKFGLGSVVVFILCLLYIPFLLLFILLGLWRGIVGNKPKVRQGPGFRDKTAQAADDGEGSASPYDGIEPSAEVEAQGKNDEYASITSLSDIFDSLCNCHVGGIGEDGRALDGLIWHFSSHFLDDESIAGLHTLMEALRGIEVDARVRFWAFLQVIAEISPRFLEVELPAELATAVEDALADAELPAVQLNAPIPKKSGEFDARWRGGCLAVVLTFGGLWLAFPGLLRHVGLAGWLILLIISSPAGALLGHLISEAIRKRRKSPPELPEKQSPQAGWRVESGDEFKIQFGLFDAPENQVQEPEPSFSNSQTGGSFMYEEKVIGGWLDVQFGTILFTESIAMRQIPLGSTWRPGRPAPQVVPIQELIEKGLIERNFGFVEHLWIDEADRKRLGRKFEEDSILQERAQDACESFAVLFAQSDAAIPERIKPVALFRSPVASEAKTMLSTAHFGFQCSWSGSVSETLMLTMLRGSDGWHLMKASCARESEENGCGKPSFTDLV